MDKSSQIILTAEEIYFLARLENGRFLDYDYIAAMPDISHSKRVHEQKCKNLLSEKGLLEEDFSGTLKVSPVIKEIAEPIYNGDYESVFSFFDGSNESVLIRFHRAGSRYTAVTQKKNDYYLDSFSLDRIIEKLMQIMNMHVNDEVSPQTVNKEDLTSIIMVKGLEPEKKSVVYVFYGCGKGVYEEHEDNSFHSIDKEKFMETMRIVLGGV